MPRAARARSNPAVHLVAPTERPIAPAPRRRAPRMVRPLALAAIFFTLGALAPEIAQRATPSPVPTTAEHRAPRRSAQPRTFPREAAALRLELDRSTSPSSSVELIERLGILGDSSDFDRLADLAEHPNPGVSQAALRALARIGGDRALDRLTVLARAHDDQQAVAAIGALGLAEAPGAVDVLLDIASNRTDWRQSAALQALSVRGGSRARAALHRGLRESPATEAWAWAQAVASLGEAPDRLLLMTLAGSSGPRADACLSALSSLGDRSADALLIELARTASGARRTTALMALGGVADAEAVEVLVDALHGNSDARMAAIGALGVSRAPGALDGLLLALDGARSDSAWQITAALTSRPEPQARAVLELLAQEDGPLADAALASLAQAGDPAAGRLLIGAFDERGELPPESTYAFLALHAGEEGWSLLEEVLAEGSTSERQSVVYALQARGDENAVTRLLDLAEGEDPWIAGSAMGALENLGDDARDRLRGLLLDRVADGEDAAFAEASGTLARLGGDDVREMLVGRLQDGTVQERAAALQALGQMDDDGARGALRETLASEDPDLRRQAFDALVWSGQPLDLDTVSAVLDDGDPGLRAQAVAALGNLGDPEATDRLLALTGDDDPSVRATAVSALGSVGGPEAEAGLLAAMDDPELFDTALWSLSNLGTRGARDAIRQAAGSDDPIRRASAISALGNDRSAASREVLIGALHDDDGGVVQAALTQLQVQGSSGSAHAVAELLTGLSEDDADPYGVRWQAANTLQALGGSVARDHQALIESVLQNAWGGLGWPEEAQWPEEAEEAWLHDPQLYLE
jgi:HEAT repeat protein